MRRFESGEVATISGVSGRTIKVYVHRVHARIGETEISIRIAFAEIEDVPYLLGRIDILDCFDILFEKDKVCFIEKGGK